MPKKVRVSAVDDGPSNDDQYVAVNAKVSKQFGPAKNRKCRDVIFLILFLAFWVGMIVVAVTAFNNGDWTRL
jgi:hypothetical protein